jgi:cell division protein FtsZ
VVATGIDVGEGQAYVAPSRSFAAAAVAARPASAPPAPQPVAAEPVVLTEADYEMDEAEPQQEPSLFAGLGVDEVEEDLAEDVVPPPAYRPAVQIAPQPEPRVDARALAAVEPDFVAPRAPAAGKPTPEALARLRAAIQKDAPRGAAPEPQAEAPHRARLGIGSLINRMTGHSEEAPASPERRQPPMSGAQAHRPAPAPHHAVDDGIVDPDQERIEIPAFLRRQAN